jgi:hypothetical protein
MFLLVAAVAMVLPACGQRDEGIRELRAAIARTNRLPQRFVYSVRTPTGATEVRGLVEDDFRFKARVSFNGTPAYDEVVDDDVLAVRFIDPARIQPFVDKQHRGDLPTDREGVTVLDALRSRRWVLDGGGAPAVTAAAAVVPKGRAATRVVDPVLEARSVLTYVGQAGTESFEVKRFDPDTLSPVYNSSEDTFPRPAQGSGVIRYDFRRPFLPAVSSAGAGGPGGEESFPEAKHFRRMAVYVKDGIIIQVRENIDLRGKSLDDFIKYQRAFIREAKLPARVRQQYELLVRETPRDELSTKLLLFLNTTLEQAGIDPIPVRQMVFDLRDAGEPIQVALPEGEIITGSLEQLTISGRAETETTAGSSATTTTTAATTETTTVP